MNTGIAKSIREIKDGPFCWQSKRVLRLIRNCFDSTNNVGSALAVYVALTEIASDEQSEVFDRRIGEIAARAGVSYRTAAKVLPRFELLGILDIRRNKISGTNENAPSIYRLLRLGNGCPTLGNGQNPVSFPRRIEESPEQSSEKSRTNSNKLETRHSAEWRLNYSDYKLEVIDLYNNICVPHEWRSVNRFSDQLETSLDTFLHLSLEEFREMFEAAVEERDAGNSIYNKPRGNKLIRILWSNY